MAFLFLYFAVCITLILFFIATLSLFINKDKKWKFIISGIFTILIFLLFVYLCLNKTYIERFVGYPYINIVPMILLLLFLSDIKKIRDIKIRSGYLMAMILMFSCILTGFILMLVGFIK